ncbi:sulfotransferase [Nonomuraea sp. K274]|uniref:Sulfotransferase n=1 Tax=Nonomuraea cypriaca TaxID=1187855 RepID=A0A931F105_9ACTN|nr:sulfotransferase [Nonomuraea cypriaca]MBF8186923.1 sulfotransferase [Nonomuraea cypriaca]
MSTEATTIDDLACPRFTPMVESMRAFMVRTASPHLEPSALMDTAMAETGLSDFGDPSFHEPLAVLCESLAKDVSLSPFGQVYAWNQISRLLMNRLLVEDLVRTDPSILDISIERPIVIAGMPRSGTTHLHNLLSADPALRSMPFWEANEPVPPPQERRVRARRDPRLDRAKQVVGMLNTCMPRLRQMHEMTVGHRPEEIHLLALAFSTLYFETWAGGLPTYRDWYRSADQTFAYRYLRKVLQVLTRLRGGSRWVLKSPQHLELFEPLSTVFPDATVVVTHRDPYSVATSFATMHAYTARMYLDKVDVARVGAYWADRTRHMLAACTGTRDLPAPERSIDVRFAALVADNLAVAEAVYERAGQPFTDVAREQLAAYVAAHPPGRHGRVAYDRGILGTDDGWGETFAAYIRRFGVEEET